MPNHPIFQAKLFSSAANSPVPSLVLHVKKYIPSFICWVPPQPCITRSPSRSREPRSSPVTLKKENSKAAPRWEVGASFLLPSISAVFAVAALASPGLSPAIVAGHPHAQFGGRGLVTRARQTPESQHHPSSSVTQSFTCEETPPLLPNSTGFLLHSAGFQLLPHHNFSLAFFFLDVKGMDVTFTVILR